MTELVGAQAAHNTGFFSIEINKTLDGARGNWADDFRVFTFSETNKEGFFGVAAFFKIFFDNFSSSVR